MINTVIVFGKGEWEREKPFDDENHQYCYEHFYTMGSQQGVRFFRASYQWYDKEEKSFKYAWEFANGSWQRSYNIIADLVYDKTKYDPQADVVKREIMKYIPVLNHPDFSDMARDKFEMSLRFPQYMKKCYLINSKEDLQKISKEIPGEKIVLKPIIGSGGQGVVIAEKKNTDSISIVEPMLAQEFIDSSNGIDGIAKGMHDLRLVFVGKNLIYSYMRQPADGCYLANLAQGGSLMIVDQEKLPKSLDPIVGLVQKEFEQYGSCIYTIDFMFDEKQQPWIVEINTKPGLYYVASEKESITLLYQALISLFLAHARA